MCFSLLSELKLGLVGPRTPIYWAGLQSFFSGVAGASLRCCGPPCLIVLQRSIIGLICFIISVICCGDIGPCGICPGAICAAA